MPCSLPRVLAVATGSGAATQARGPLCFLYFFEPAVEWNSYTRSSSFPALRQEGSDMLDLTMLAAGIVFFGVAIGYAFVCERL
jgi:hypothetical protein